VSEMWVILITAQITAEESREIELHNYKGCFHHERPLKRLYLHVCVCAFDLWGGMSA